MDNVTPGSDADEPNEPQVIYVRREPWNMTWLQAFLIVGAVLFVLWVIAMLVEHS